MRRATSSVVCHCVKKSLQPRMIQILVNWLLSPFEKKMKEIKKPIKKIYSVGVSVPSSSANQDLRFFNVKKSEICKNEILRLRLLDCLQDSRIFFARFHLSLSPNPATLL